MKKKGWIMTIAIATIVLGSGSALAANAFSPTIGKQEAKKIALKEVPGTVTDIDLERERGNLVYEVEVMKKDSFDEVEVHLSADSGKVITTVHDVDDDRNMNRNDSSTSPNATAANTNQNAITKDQAGKLALAVVKGDLLQVESDSDDGFQHYEVKINTSSGVVEVDIAAVGGKILSIDAEDDYDDYDNGDDDDNDDD